jgi:hypothetical protein
VVRNDASLTAWRYVRACADQNPRPRPGVVAAFAAAT